MKNTSILIYNWDIAKEIIIHLVGLLPLDVGLGENDSLHDGELTEH